MRSRKARFDLSVCAQFVRVTLLLIAVLTIGPVFAQAPPPSAPSPVSASASKHTTPAETRAALDAVRIELEQQEVVLRRPNLSSTDLQDLRGRIEPVAERLRDVIGDLAPQFDAARDRLQQLGPKPKEGAPPEGVDVARDRAEREAALAEIDETQRIAKALLVQAEQLTAQVSDRRRSAFASALFERSYSLLSPDLWLSTGGQLPRDLRALNILSQDTLSRFSSRSTPWTLTLLGLAIGAAVAFHVVRKQLAPRLVSRGSEIREVERRRRLRASFGVLVFEAAPAAAGAFVVYHLLVAADLFPPRLYPVVGAALGGLAFVAFLRGALDAILAPDHPSWRIAALSDPAAAWTTNLLVAFGAIVAAGKVLDAVNYAIAARLPLTVATRAVVAFVAAATLAELLRRFAVAVAPEDECLGPYIPTEPEIGGPFRLLGWAVVAAIAVSLLGGYVAFASFVVDQVAWIGSLIMLLYLSVSLSDEFLGETLRRSSGLSTALQSNLGLRRRALEQLGVLAAGILRVVLVIAAIMLVLAPWGVESSDIASNLRAAFFGFKVGDITISLSTTFFALLILGLGLAATRIVQRWLANTFLPTTELDAGLRNSLQTVAGYIGFFLAAAAAFSYLGLGLDKIAIVAGALSVGIGFGLQSIVNNFVSGLILLWERPIRVGDLVVIGDGEGYVRRISVRATEIETFDRSSVIIPNSNLISGVVKNRVRGDRGGRVVVPVQILRNQDPGKAAELLVASATAHPDVVGDPPPNVVFRKIGETWLDLDLVCFVNDVTNQLRVSSDLHFAIFAALVRDGILPPLGPGAVTVGGLDKAQLALDRIADAMNVGRSAGGGSPEESRSGTSEGAEPRPA